MFEVCRRFPGFLLVVPVLLVIIAACGGDDDDDDGGDNGDGNGGDNPPQASDGNGNGGDVEMVPLSSLDLDLPFEMSYDPPMPSDSTVSNAVEREGSGATHAGYDLTVETSATYEEMKPAYDEYVADFELVSEFPEQQSWTGRRAVGEPGFTITVLPDGRLNIAEILDN